MHAELRVALRQAQGERRASATLRQAQGERGKARAASLLRQLAARFLHRRYRADKVSWTRKGNGKDDEMRVHYFQHVAFEGLGSMGPWLQAAGDTVTATRFYESAILPRLEDIDWLIIMGGPMSVNDEAALPWLAAEKRFIRQTVEAGKRVLGVCLGAQLIANVMGGRVYANAVREIGWFPVHGMAAPGADTFRFPATMDAFHWHGETFDLPAGAVRLARSEACANQAFQLGRSVMGLQFHLETTPPSVRELVAHGREELVPAPYVQSEAQILGAPLQHYAAINDLMGDVLSYLRAAGD